MKQFWVTHHGERRGPYEESEILEAVELGTIRPTDLLWVQGMREGVPIYQVFAHLGAAAGPPSRPGAAPRPAEGVGGGPAVAAGDVAPPDEGVARRRRSRGAARKPDRLCRVLGATGRGGDRYGAPGDRRARGRGGGAGLDRAHGGRSGVRGCDHARGRLALLRADGIEPRRRDVRQARAPSAGADRRPHAARGLPSRDRTGGGALGLRGRARDRVLDAALHRPPAGAARPPGRNGRCRPRPLSGRRQYSAAGPVTRRVSSSSYWRT